MVVENATANVAMICGLNVTHEAPQIIIWRTSLRCLMALARIFRVLTLHVIIPPTAAVANAVSQMFVKEMLP
jgi:hypothetical protein